MERLLMVGCFLPVVVMKLTEREETYITDPFFTVLSIGLAIFGLVVTLIYVTGYGMHKERRP